MRLSHKIGVVSVTLPLEISEISDDVNKKLCYGRGNRDTLVSID